MDESRVEFSCQQRVRQVSEEFLQQSCDVVDAVLIIKMHFPPLIKLLTKLDETLSQSVLAAEINYPWHLFVNRVKAELFVAGFLPVPGRLVWQRQLKGLQEPRLVIIKVSDAIHRHSTLSVIRVTTMYLLECQPPHLCCGKMNGCTHLKAASPACRVNI
ncbi:hypothetical protein GOODEAATRI_013358 [Goodea atripinnis]|uniref:Uncharacterized protein n=1 Tax=Goodea atripinnis TaxID=208336 RepID=A0ABV0P534_9TELE